MKKPSKGKDLGEKDHLTHCFVMRQIINDI